MYNRQQDYIHYDHREPHYYDREDRHRELAMEHISQRLAQHMHGSREFIESRIALDRARDELDAAIHARMPYVTVEYKGREIVISRKTMNAASLMALYDIFTKSFELKPSGKDQMVKYYDKQRKKYYNYIPMRLSVKLWRDPPNNGATRDDTASVYRDIPEWEDSWAQLAYYVERIRIRTRSEYEADLTQDLESAGGGSKESPKGSPRRAC